jgi:hypothetical protein
MDIAILSILKESKSICFADVARDDIGIPEGDGLPASP